MEERTDPAEAVLALGEIDRRREQAIRGALRAAFPVWYWWAQAALVVAFTAVFESGHGAVVWIDIVLLTAGQLVIGLPASRAAGRVRLRRGLDNPGPAWATLAGIAAFVAVVMGVALATGLSLKAARVSHPGTIAAAVAAVVFAAGGQLLIRRLTTVLVRRAASRP